jgi:hypothetical protein
MNEPVAAEVEQVMGSIRLERARDRTDRELHITRNYERTIAQSDVDVRTPASS